jgi:hypothetical protein
MKKVINKLKQIAIKFTPLRIQKYYFNHQRFKKTRYLTSKDIFTEIYFQNAWGKPETSEELFFSGPGSHNEDVVSTYVNAILNFLISFDKKLDAVDLGCGDFGVGSKIRKYFNNYTACDVVEPLVDFNRGKYKALFVDFLVLDIIKDDLPSGDIVFIRQVLQHLSNKQISEIVNKLTNRYKYIIIKEHLPLNYSFKANKDKPPGSNTRLDVRSGVVLTLPPFNLKVQSESILCQASEGDGIIQTKAYQMY